MENPSSRQAISITATEGSRIFAIAHAKRATIKLDIRLHNLLSGQSNKVFAFHEQGRAYTYEVVNRITFNVGIPMLEFHFASIGLIV